MKYGKIIFDLDGTLADTLPSITRSLKAIIKDFGVDSPSEELLRAMVGPPLKEAFTSVFNMDGETADRAIVAFRKHYSAGEMLTAKLYGGVEETLKTLKAEGYSLFVATSKPEQYANKILSHLGVDKYFDLIAGSNTDGTRTKKCEVIESLLQRTGDKTGYLMVGDKALDAVGAKCFGIDTVLVSYGYATKDEIENGDAVAVIDSFAALTGFLKEVNK